MPAVRSWRMCGSRRGSSRKSILVTDLRSAEYRHLARGGIRGNGAAVYERSRHFLRLVCGGGRDLVPT
jgi:hypothetical protein